MNSETLNKTLRLAINEATDPGTRANAISNIRNAIGADKDFDLMLFDRGSETPLSKARMIAAQKTIEVNQLTDRLHSIESALKRINNGLKSRELVDVTGMGGTGTEVDQAFANNALQWMVNEMIAAGVDGISKAALMAKVTLPNHKKSISKRWSDLTKFDYGFLIGDLVVVSKQFADQHPAKWTEHQRLRDKMTTGGKTKMRAVIDDDTMVVTIRDDKRETA